MTRCEEIVTEDEERGTIMKVLEAWGYLRWTVKNPKNDIEKIEEVQTRNAG